MHATALKRCSHAWFFGRRVMQAFGGLLGITFNCQ